MADAKEAKKSERRQDVPVYRVTQEPGFPTGMHFFKPGEEIDWEVPEGWNTEKHGKHFAVHGPSITFEPMNEKAAAHMKAHKEQLKERNRPKPQGDPQVLAQLIETQKVMAEMQAENRKLTERLLDLLEKQAEKKK